MGGIVALVYAAVASLLHRGRVAPHRGGVSAWYWHFMAVLWIYIFAVAGFVRW